MPTNLTNLGAPLDLLHGCRALVCAHASLGGDRQPQLQAGAKLDQREQLSGLDVGLVFRALAWGSSPSLAFSASRSTRAASFGLNRSFAKASSVGASKHSAARSSILSARDEVVAVRFMEWSLTSLTAKCHHEIVRLQLQFRIRHRAERRARNVRGILRQHAACVTRFGWLPRLATGFEFFGGNSQADFPLLRIYRD